MPAPALPELPPVQHAGERVLTTELLARAFGVDEKALQDNFQANRDRFAEGVHLFRLEGDDLRAFKDRPENSGSVGRQARSLLLWTERGAPRHAKMLHTDAAWAIFGKLEETYFATIAAPPMALSPRAIREIEGIVSEAVRSALSPAAIEAAILNDPRRAALDLVSVRQLLDEAKVPSKGRNKINRRIGRRLNEQALHMTARGEPSPHRRCAHTTTWLYARDFAERFMRERGRALVADHLAGLTGQTVIPFPNAPARPPDPG